MYLNFDDTSAKGSVFAWSVHHNCASKQRSQDVLQLLREWSKTKSGILDHLNQK